MDATIQVSDSRRGHRESSRREDTAICKIPRRERISRGDELERVWPLLEAINLQATTFGGGS